MACTQALLRQGADVEGSVAAWQLDRLLRAQHKARSLAFVNSRSPQVISASWGEVDPLWPDAQVWGLPDVALRLPYVFLPAGQFKLRRGIRLRWATMLEVWRRATSRHGPMQPSDVSTMVVSAGTWEQVRLHTGATLTENQPLAHVLAIRTCPKIWAFDELHVLAWSSRCDAFIAGRNGPDGGAAGRDARPSRRHHSQLHHDWQSVQRHAREHDAPALDGSQRPSV